MVVEGHLLPLILLFLPLLPLLVLSPSGVRFQMGLLSYDLSTVTFVLGVMAYFGVSWLTIAVILLIAYAWLNVNLQVGGQCKGGLAGVSIL